MGEEKTEEKRGSAIDISKEDMGHDKIIIKKSLLACIVYSEAKKHRI